MGKREQRKGADGERELVQLLNGYGYDTQRGGSLTYGSVPDVYGLAGVHIEVKRQEALDLWQAIKQAEQDAERFKDGLPAVFHRKSRQGWIVSMTLDNWIRLYNGQIRAILSRKDGK